MVFTMYVFGEDASRIVEKFDRCLGGGLMIPGSPHLNLGFRLVHFMHDDLSTLAVLGWADRP
jgi:hypothetical protein